MKEPLDQNQSRKLVLRILKSGKVRFSGHALKELKKDQLTREDALNVLRAGKIFDPPEYENGSWRYRVQTWTITVVVAFDGEEALVVVTGWRRG